MDLTDNKRYIAEVGEPKKRGRKSKKQNEKELLQEYNLDEGLKRKTYENIQYLSYNEKQNFENKFTKPININQEEYVATLRNKNKKIIMN